MAVLGLQWLKIDRSIFFMTLVSLAASLFAYLFDILHLGRGEIHPIVLPLVDIAMVFTCLLGVLSVGVRRMLLSVISGLFVGGVGAILLIRIAQVFGGF